MSCHVATDRKHADICSAPRCRQPDAQPPARWCRKNGLADEAKFHWSTVLANQPPNDEASRPPATTISRSLMSLMASSSKREMKDRQAANGASNRRSGELRPATKHA
jgi:hypothetical protein